jgi:predicted HicB family RNase H-like nuclease
MPDQVKFTLRLPESLHAQLTTLAEKKQVSLNTWMLEKLQQPAHNTDGPRLK